MNGSKPVAIVLGGTVPHVQLVQKLKARGYHVVLADYLDNPPAKAFADEHVKVSTLDRDAVLEVAKSRQAALVISTCVDQANVTCCYVAERLGLPHPYGLETSLDVTDKVRMKRIMQEKGIPTARHTVVNRLADLESLNLRLPVIVKPADSNSAKGVRKVHGEEELRAAFQDAVSASRNGSVIVEEFAEGVEVSAYCVVVRGRPKLLMVQERVSVLEDPSYGGVKCFASVVPARLSKAAYSAIEEILGQIAAGFGLDNTPLFMQAKVDGNTVTVIEFAPRVGGGVSSKTIREGTGYDVIEAAIDSFLEREITVDGCSPIDGWWAVNQIYGRSGVFAEARGSEELLSRHVIVDIDFYKARGSSIDGGSASSGRIGVMRFKGVDEQDLRQKIRQAFATIDCLDQDGVSMIRRDLNLDSLWGESRASHETPSA